MNDALIDISLLIVDIFSGKVHTCSVFGGKNSNEKVGFPDRWASANRSLICIVFGLFVEELVTACAIVLAIFFEQLKIVIK